MDPFAAVAEGSPDTVPKKKTKPAVPADAPVLRAEISAVEDHAKPASNKSASKKSPKTVPAIDAFAETAMSVTSRDEISLEITTQNKRSATAKSPGATGAKAPGAEPVTKKAAGGKTALKRRAPSKSRPADAALQTVSSPVAAKAPVIALDATKEIAAKEPEVEISPAFKALAEPKLPELPRENRARLQMQSPTRLYFYWSLRTNPWQQLAAVFGSDLGSYTLVVKLSNVTAGTEQLQAIETEGDWWFNDVQPGSEYAAEIGFYAVNRPYFRVLYSNSITTPRRTPSARPATEARWTVSATKFAEVLDASGFSRDAVDVAIAGDDHLDAENRTRLAFSEVMGNAEYSTRGISAEDLRYAMLAVAGGATLSELRDRVSSSVYEALQANEDLSAATARQALSSYFEIEETEWIEHEFGPAVFGASLVNFPKTLTPRKDVKYSPRYNPVSSFALGR